MKIHTDDDLIGLGEVSCTPLWSGEDSVTAAHFIDNFFGPLLLGANPLEIERLTSKLNYAVAGNPFTKAALEMALWDILGKAAGLPLYQLLGGAVRDFVPTKISLSGIAPHLAAEMANWAVETGFRFLKVKVGVEPDEDVARVRAIREAVGPQIKLGVDANGGWSPRGHSDDSPLAGIRHRFRRAAGAGLGRGVAGRCAPSRYRPNHRG